jgi:hypothetical protein
VATTARCAAPGKVSGQRGVPALLPWLSHLSPFVTSNSVAGFPISVLTKQPWLDEDKLRAYAVTFDAGQINNTEGDVSLYQTHWERLERLRQLIGVIESKDENQATFR